MNSLFGEARHRTEFGVANCQLEFERSRFSQGKRTTQAGATADMIISSGGQLPTPAVLATGQCLKQRIPGPVHTYPRDVLELGATANAIGRALMQLGHAGFVHLEISRGLRERIRNESALRQAVLQCMAATRS